MVAALALVPLGGGAQAAPENSSDALQERVTRDKPKFSADLIGPFSPEPLLLSTAKKLTEKYGAKSAFVGAIYCKLFEYYVQQNLKSDAQDAAQKVLACDLRCLEFPPGYALQNADRAIAFISPVGDTKEDGLKFQRFANNALIEGSLALAKSEQYELADSILENLLKSLKLSLEADDLRIAITMVAIGDVRAQRMDQKGADEMYKSAVNITKLHEVEHWSWSTSFSSQSSSFRSFLRRGKYLRRGTVELDKVDTLKHRKLASDTHVLPKDVEVLRRELGRELSRAPYGSRAIALINALIVSGLTRENWSEVKKYANQGLILSEHADGFDYASMLKYCKQIVEADLKLDNKTGARASIKELLKRLPATLTARELYDLATMQVDAGAKSAAMLTLKKLEPLCNSRVNAHLLPEVEKLYTRLSEKELAQNARDEYMTAHLKSLEYDWRMKADLEKSNSAKEQTATEAGAIVAPFEPAPDRTGAGKDFPPVELVSDAYKFNYAAMASDSLTFDGASKVAIYSGPGAFKPHTLAATFGKLKTNLDANHSGNLSFVVGNSADVTPDAIVLPPAMSLPFRACLTAPKNCKVLSGNESVLVLKPGDYSTTGLYLDSLIIPRVGGRVRIFIEERKDDGVPVFKAYPGSFINANTGFGPANQGQQLEIWYAGTGTIKLDDGSVFAGIIYAPNARVEIGPGKATFTGAIVARDIYACGDAVVTYNENLKGWTAP